MHERTKRALSVLILMLGFLATLIPAQEAQDRSVEQKLLEILRERGVITEGEYSDLKTLAEDLRREDDLEGRLDAEVSQLVARLADEQPRTSYKIGKGFSWTTPDGNFKMTIGGRLQVRFTYDFWDKNEKTGNESEPDFDIPRARIWVTGHIFDPALTYKLQFEIAGDEADTRVSLGGMSGTFSSGNRETEMKDGYFNYAFSKGFQIRGGQFKAPYSRHQLASTKEQPFVDRSLVNKVFAPARNAGLMIHGRLGGEDGDLFQYFAGAFDGEGENKTNNDEGLMWVGRIAVTPLGPMSYNEADFEHREDLVIAIGVNGWYHQNDNHMNVDDEWAIGGDVAAMWNGWYFTGEIHYSENEGTNPDTKVLGWFAQLGYMVVPETFQLAVRATRIDFDDNTSGSGFQEEYLLAAVYYFERHNAKLQADFGYISKDNRNPDKRTDGWRLRIQFQIIF